MEEVMDFLKTNKVFYLATVDADNQARVRPMGFVMNYKGKLAFGTSNEKSMYRQLKADPKVDICCIDAEYNTLRLSGRAVFCTNGESQKLALEIMPSLSRMYSVGDGKFEIFYLDDARAYCQSMAGDRKVLDV